MIIYIDFLLFYLIEAKRAGEDYGGGEFKRPRVEVRSMRYHPGAYCSLVTIWLACLNVYSVDN